MDWSSKFNASILTGLVFSVLILGLGSSIPNASAGGGSCFGGSPSEFHLIDGDGFCWDIDKTEGDVDDGTDDAFDDYVELEINDVTFNSSTDGILVGRTVTVGPETLDECFEVTRKIFVPDNDGFARWLDIIKNICDASSDINIFYDNDLGSDSDTELLATSSGDIMVTSADDWMITDDQEVGDTGFDPRITIVISDTFAPVQPTTFRQVDGDTDDDDIDWEFDTNISPGERIIIMTFVVQSNLETGSDSVGTSANVIVANNLRALTGLALDGMSGDEIRDLVNFLRKTSGSTGHEPPTIGKSLDGVRQLVDGGIAIDGQTWTVSQQYHQEFELLQMLSSPHTISNVIHCAKGVQYCNYIAVGFMGLTDDFNNPVMTVSATKAFNGDWTLGWYDPDDFISDPDDAVAGEIVFVPQVIDTYLLGTSFTIDFKNKDTGQLKMGIQVRDSYNGVRNFFFNEGVEFIDADAYPQVESAYDAPVEVESLCFGQNNPDRNSCQFSKMKDWATQNAEETLRQMMGNQYQYDQ